MKKVFISVCVYETTNNYKLQYNNR